MGSSRKACSPWHSTGCLNGEELGSCEVRR